MRGGGRDKEQRRERRDLGFDYGGGVSCGVLWFLPRRLLRLGVVVVHLRRKRGVWGRRGGHQAGCKEPGGANQTGAAALSAASTFPSLVVWAVQALAAFRALSCSIPALSILPVAKSIYQKPVASNDTSMHLELASARFALLVPTL